MRSILLNHRRFGDGVKELTERLHFEVAQINVRTGDIIRSSSAEHQLRPAGTFNLSSITSTSGRSDADAAAVTSLQHAGAGFGACNSQHGHSTVGEVRTLRAGVARRDEFDGPSTHLAAAVGTNKQHWRLHRYDMGLCTGSLPHSLCGVCPSTSAPSAFTAACTSGLHRRADLVPCFSASLTMRRHMAQDAYATTNSELATLASEAAASPVYSNEQLSMYTAMDTSPTLVLLKKEVDRYYDKLDASVLTNALDRAIRASRPNAEEKVAKDALVATLGTKFVELLPVLDPVMGVQLLHTFANLQHAPGGEAGLQQVSAMAMEHWVGPRGVSKPLKTSSQPTYLVDLLWALGKLKHNNPELNMELGQLLTNKVKVLPMRSLSKLADACAKFTPVLFLFPLLTEIVNAAKPRIQDMEPPSLVTLVQALGRLQFKYMPELNDAIIDVVSRRLKEFSTPRISDLLSGFFGMSHNTPALQELLGSVCVQTVRGIAALKPEDVSKLAYTFARYKYNEPESVALYNALSVHGADHMREFKPRHIANLLYAMGRLQHRNPKLIEAATWHLQHPVVLAQCTIQNLSNALWGLSKLRLDGEVLPASREMLYTKAAVAIKGLLARFPEEFAAQNFSDLAWSFSVVHQGDDELYQALAKNARGCVDKMSLRCLVELAWAMANASCYDAPLFKAIEVRFKDVIQDCGPDFLSKVLWAFAVVEHTPSEGSQGLDGEGPPTEDLLLLAAQQVEVKWDRVLNMEEQQQASLIWAFHKLRFHERHPQHAVSLRFNELMPDSAQMFADGGSQPLAAAPQEQQQQQQETAVVADVASSTQQPEVSAPEEASPLDAAAAAAPTVSPASAPDEQQRQQQQQQQEEVDGSPSAESLAASAPTASDQDPPAARAVAHVG